MSFALKILYVCEVFCSMVYTNACLEYLLERKEKWLLDKKIGYNP